MLDAAHIREPAASPTQVAEERIFPSEQPPRVAPNSSLKWAAVAGALAIAFGWAYWPTLCDLAQTWLHEPDWSHGLLVPPAALCILWTRRDRFPAGAPGSRWPGLALLLFSLAMRYAAAWYYLDAVDGWSILFWMAGAVWLVGGRQVLEWALPSIVFLGFMVRFPYHLEQALRGRLQTIATDLACWMLHLVGQRAVVHDHTIMLGPHRLDVQPTCSGLVIFMSIMAVAYAFVVVVRRPWWERVLLLASISVALVVNALRIAAMGLLCSHVSDEAALKLGHDAVGWGMIVGAAGLFALVVWYLGKVAPEVEYIEAEEVPPKDASHG